MLTDHHKTVKQYARERARKRRESQEYGDYIESLLRWEWFVTITFKRLRCQDVANERLERFFACLELFAGSPIGWVRVEDFGKIGGRLHAHALIAGVSSLDVDGWQALAAAEFGSSEFEPFKLGAGGARYLVKHALSKTGNLHFGGGLLHAHRCKR